MKPPVAAQPSMSMLSRLLTALEQTPGVHAATLHANGPHADSTGLYNGAERMTKAASLGRVLQVFVEGDRAVLLDDVGDGRHLHLEGTSGQFGRWRYAVERHRPLIGRIHEEVA